MLIRLQKIGQTAIQIGLIRYDGGLRCRGWPGVVVNTRKDAIHSTKVLEKVWTWWNLWISARCISNAIILRFDVNFHRFPLYGRDFEHALVQNRKTTHTSQESFGCIRRSSTFRKPCILHLLNFKFSFFCQKTQNRSSFFSQTQSKLSENVGKGSFSVG